VIESSIQSSPRNRKVGHSEGSRVRVQPLCDQHAIPRKSRNGNNNKVYMRLGASNVPLHPHDSVYLFWDWYTYIFF
jgi:hypothetical protein